VWPELRLVVAWVGPLPKPPKKEKAAPKRMRNKGPATLKYEHWRDTVAIPYLDATYGHICSVCGCGGALDVAHIKGRGANAHLKMVLMNVKYLCRYDHMKADSGFMYK